MSKDKHNHNWARTPSGVRCSICGKKKIRRQSRIRHWTGHDGLVHATIEKD